MASDLRRPPRNPTLSPRHLALRHVKKQLRALDATVKDEPPPIPHGKEQLYSFYVPGLQAGVHTITVEQEIKTRQGTQDQETQTLPGEHDFNVIAPRFSLPEGALNSFYPPQGHADRGEVLPSVVFNDPTLPWEREASQKKAGQGVTDYARNRVPWLAVFLFTQEELRLSNEELDTVFSDPGLKKQNLAKQSATLSTTMLARDTPRLNQNITNNSPIIYDQSDGDAKTDVIFLRKELFTSLFAEYGSDGKKKDNPKCYVRHHRFLAHLRHINLDGTPTAGKTDNDDHVYSVVMSHRIGTLEITKPTPVVAHLVNIEGVERMDSSFDQTFVAMSSLYSWEYTCLPPDSLNIEDAFAHLGSSLNVLKPIPINKETKGTKATTDDNPKIIIDRMNLRVNDGFSLLRYRIQTGEVTAAFSKSPFTPKAVKFNDPLWPPSATTGTKLQILDPNLNLMDITYSAAWNLGKTLGLAHPEFATALARVRKQIFDMGMNDAQMKRIQQRSKELGIPTMFKTREQVLATLKDTVTKLKDLPFDATLKSKPDGMVRRWHRPSMPPLDLSYHGPDISAIIRPCFREAAKKISSSIEDSKVSEVPYNEFNMPYSTDWAVVLRWIMDRYFLVDVPPHYLITDPSHLPMETMRVFAIDHAWVSAMIDGGLSLANHLDQDDDRVRNAIKWAFNRFLDYEYPDVKYKPLTPRYGFYVRSTLVTKFPDLIVGIETKTGDGKTTVPLDEAEPPVLLRHDIVDKSVMLGLMREPPKDDGSISLFLRQPPHQQYFSAAADITTKMIKMEYKRVYTKQDVNDPDQHTPIEYTYLRDSKSEGPSPAVFIWGTADNVRVLNIEAVAQQHVDELNDTYAKVKHPEWYDDPTPNSALMGIQLSEPQWQIEITLPTKDTFPNLFKDVSRDLPVPPDPDCAPSTVAKVTSKVECSPHPAFGNRKRPAPIVPTYHPPHVRLPRFISNAHTATESRAMVGPPKFKHGLYPVGQVGETIPMLPLDKQGRPQRQDLIFSIVYESGIKVLLMTKFVIEIKMGTYGQLIKDYTGTGPSMLSNLRFNVMQQFDPINDKLVLTLVPRSTKHYVPIGSIAEMSVLLSGVVVNRYEQETEVTVDAWEYYTDRGPWKRPFKTTLVKPTST
ncbi:hypothetical protein ASPWEDRAFT_746225 [Aspergillus wentii DTO 134E9]|uniref:Uncharacterized protein n=1 Tax=Aspergillus wentii DTO 134E9 TaxID=1073089 RepID=A0A1L9RC68_ASPWE|nr:uncharacterized protein ASPWEDRAFT_746225 [Aspergillus wentii DTO 134E9]KAI9935073.1 hypothetical protein MW887_000694 [Aspergillus wentii]OJJ32514.1 hypothetical protein ASPWEDRAFT_746225 [Aspergillus wentii DTO 134E9]